MVSNNRKFNNTPKTCSKGHNHPSKGECYRCEHLHLALKSKECPFIAIEYEKSYPLLCNGIKVCTHKPDFTLTMKDGSTQIDEFKGIRTAVFNLKLKLFKINYPDIKYVITTK